MTVNIENSKSGPYQCDGIATQFPIEFTYIEPGMISVYIYDENGVESKLGANEYVISDQICVIEPPLSASFTVIILREPEITQNIAIGQRQKVYLPDIEEVADRLTMCMQRLKERLDRAVLVSPLFDGDLMEIDQYVNIATGAADLAVAARDAAVTSASAALLSEGHAADSESNALSSENAAAASEANALASENNAASSEASAASSAAYAADRANQAQISAVAADTSAANALASETNASASEANALTSETNAATSEANALTSETNAASSEGAAQSYKNQAETYKFQAEASALAASISEANASQSEIDAGVHQSSAATYASNAANSASSALSYKNLAEAAKTAAETSEANALTSETNAATSEANALTSETNAASSETNAASSEGAAQTYKNQAETYKIQAAASASAASISEANASQSEIDAGVHQSSAATYASNASTSATNASTYATSALGYRNQADTYATNASNSADAAYAAQLAAEAAAAEAGGVFTFTSTSALLNDTANSENPNGLTINQLTNSDELLSMKSSYVNHGFTNETETDTFGSIKKYDTALGCALITGFSEDGANTGIVLRGISGTLGGVTSSTAAACVMVETFVRSGTVPAQRTTPASDRNIFAVRNGNVTNRLLLKGNGTLYLTNNVPVALDEEDDMALIDAAKNLLTDEKKGMSKEKIDKLHQLGLVNEDGSMISVQGIPQLTFGALGQMWRGLRYVADKAGVSEADLKTFMIGIYDD